MTMMAKCRAKATPIIVVFATPPAAKASVRTTVVSGENDARLSSPCTEIIQSTKKHTASNIANMNKHVPQSQNNLSKDKQLFF